MSLFFNIAKIIEINLHIIWWKIMFNIIFIIVIACLEFRWQTITSVAYNLKKSGCLPREQEFRNVEFHPTPLNICLFARHSKRFDASPRASRMSRWFFTSATWVTLRGSQWLSSAATWMMRASDLLRWFLKFIIYTFMWGDTSWGYWYRLVHWNTKSREFQGSP